MNLWEELRKSFVIFQKNIVLLVPIALQVFASIFFGAFFLFLGIFFVTAAQGKPFTFGSALNVAAMQPSSWLIGGILFALFLLVMFIVNAFFSAGLYSMVLKAVQNKTRWTDFNLGVKVYFKSFLAFTFLYGVAIIILLLPLLIGVGFLVYIPLLGALILFFGIVFFVLGALCLWVSFFFVPPILFTYKLDAIAAMKESWRFMTTNFLFTLGTIGISLLISIGVAVVLSLMLLPFQLIATQSGGWTLVLYQFLDFVRVVIEVLLSVVFMVFMFQAFTTRTQEIVKANFKKQKA